MQLIVKEIIIIKFISRLVSVNFCNVWFWTKNFIFKLYSIEKLWTLIVSKNLFLALVMEIHLMQSILVKTKNFMVPFLWMGLNCLKATEPLQGDSLLITI